MNIAQFSISGYDLILIDCDGVIINSNYMKEQNIKESLQKYLNNPDDVNSIVHSFTKNNGLPREQKLRMFISDERILTNILNDYNHLNLVRITKSIIIDGFEENIRKLSKSKKYVLSGADTSELNHILHSLQLDQYFNGILGAPKTKMEHVSELIFKSGIFIGDSEYDVKVAEENKIDFILMTKFTQWLNWETEIRKYNCVKIIVKDWNEIEFIN